MREIKFKINEDKHFKGMLLEDLVCCYCNGKKHTIKIGRIAATVCNNCRVKRLWPHDYFTIINESTIV